MVRRVIIEGLGWQLHLELLDVVFEDILKGALQVEKGATATEFKTAIE